MKSFAKKLLTKLGISTIDPAPNPSASEFEINNWALSDVILKKLVHVVGVHPYPLNELMLMAKSVCRFRPTHVFEWGTNVGPSARVFYETARYFKMPLEIHSIVLPGEAGHVEHPGNRRGKLMRGKPSVSLHLGDGIETSLVIYRTLPADSCVLFFFDGDHSYVSVKRELDATISAVAAPRCCCSTPSSNRRIRATTLGLIAPCRKHWLRKWIASACARWKPRSVCPA